MINGVGGKRGRGAAVPMQHLLFPVAGNASISAPAIACNQLRLGFVIRGRRLRWSSKSERKQSGQIYGDEQTPSQKSGFYGYLLCKTRNQTHLRLTLMLREETPPRIS